MCVFDKCRHEGNRYNALLHRNANNNERILGILAVIKRFCNVKKAHTVLEGTRRESSTKND